jgi:hypothetical protein
MEKKSMSNRQFVYCENTEGGMDTFELETQTPPSLRGWMSADCKAEDTRLLKWMETATVGQWTDHRLGACFCVAASNSEATAPYIESAVMVHGALSESQEKHLDEGATSAGKADYLALLKGARNALRQVSAMSFDPAGAHLSVAFAALEKLKVLDSIGGAGGQGGGIKA